MGGSRTAPTDLIQRVVLVGAGLKPAPTINLCHCEDANATKAISNIQWIKYP